MYHFVNVTIIIYMQFSCWDLWSTWFKNVWIWPFFFGWVVWGSWGRGEGRYSETGVILVSLAAPVLPEFDFHFSVSSSLCNVISSSAFWVLRVRNFYWRLLMLHTFAGILLMQNMHSVKPASWRCRTKGCRWWTLTNVYNFLRWHINLSCIEGLFPAFEQAG